MKIACAYTELVDLTKLVPNPKNANQHNDQQIKLLAKLMDFQGWRHPIIVSKRSGFIVAGHGRLEAANINGWEQAPVDYQDFENEAQEYAFLVSDNKIAELAETDLSMVNRDVMDLGPDFDMDLLGIPDFVIEPIEKFDPQCDEDEVPEHVEPRTKPGDIYQLGRHRLMCGDSTSIDAVERLMATEKVDMVFTDPPYGVDAVGGDKAVGGEKIVKANRYERIIGDLSPNTAKDACALLLRLNIQPMVIFGANNFAHALPESSAWLYWQKNQTGDFADGELAWTNAKGMIKRFEHTWAGLIKASEHGEKRCHPTQKPVALAEWCFEKYGHATKSVMDLFGGSGSTLIACEKTNRRCFMMEIDPHYVDIIVARWEKYAGKKAELLNGETEAAS